MVWAMSRGYQSQGSSFSVFELVVGDFGNKMRQLMRLKK